ncbi:hypothetical protein GCM10025870_15820 [Agromyces marinus]|uniref:Uncharacterized protein n=1 Tax=Agromyces marinus TaxID=1389020 RepID=A0ABN6YAY4_9MICO|nr:hypothetical protein GCM10025870_15820 [Agromyces marinus]
MDHIEARRDVRGEGRGIRNQAVDRDCGQVHDGVEPRVTGSHAQQAVERLAVVVQVDAGESGAGGSVQVEAGDLVPVVDEPGDGGPAELARASSDSDAHGGGSLRRAVPPRYDIPEPVDL